MLLLLLLRRLLQKMVQISIQFAVTEMMIQILLQSSVTHNFPFGRCRRRRTDHGDGDDTCTKNNRHHDQGSFCWVRERQELNKANSSAYTGVSRRRRRRGWGNDANCLRRGSWPGTAQLQQLVALDKIDRTKIAQPLPKIQWSDLELSIISGCCRGKCHVRGARIGWLWAWEEGCILYSTSRGEWSHPSLAVSKRVTAWSECADANGADDDVVVVVVVRRV